VDLAASPIDPHAPRERPDAPAEPAAVAGDVLDETEDPDDLFVSCVPTAGVVTRFGAGGSAFIGAKRDASAEGGVRYFPEQVLKIPGADVRRYSREYTRVLAEGALVKHSREQHKAYRVQRDQALRDAKQKREQERADVLKQAAEREAALAQEAAAGDATKTDPALAAGNETPAAPAPTTTGE
jgi:hypothetical protein